MKYRRNHLELTSRELTKGKCAICGIEIPSDWTTSPSLGTTCREHFSASVFGPENVDLALRDDVEERDHCRWRGTRVMINGREGIVRGTQGDASLVAFDPDDWMGEFISDLGFSDLERLLEESGELPRQGELSPGETQRRARARKQATKAVSTLIISLVMAIAAVIFFYGAAWMIMTRLFGWSREVSFVVFAGWLVLCTTLRVINKRR